jgi:aspartate racemase
VTAAGDVAARIVTDGGTVRTIGLLGGMSWESSSEYYRLINERVRERLEGLHSAQCVLYSVDFAPIEQMQAQDRWDDAGVALAEAAQAVQAAGADLLVLCTNTMHKLADQIRAAISIPLLDITDVVATAVTGAGIGKVGLLATAYTMEQPFYRDRLARHGLEVLVPGDEDRATVHAVIYDELCRGIVRDESRQAYRGVIERLVAHGAEGIVLGCTEIELLVGQDDSSVPVFPTTSLHAAAAVDAALAGGGDEGSGAGLG